MPFQVPGYRALLARVLGDAPDRDLQLARLPRHPELGIAAQGFDDCRAVGGRQDHLVMHEDIFQVRVPVGLAGAVMAVVVAVGGQVLVQDAPEIFFRRAGRRTIIVGQVEMGNSQVKRPPENCTTILKRVTAAKIEPEPKRQCRQLQAA